MILALSFRISIPAAARFSVLTFNSVTSLHALTLPCLSLNRVDSLLASTSLNFSYKVLNCTILFYFSVNYCVTEIANNTNIHLKV